MKKNRIRFFIEAFIPFIIFVLVYAILDPFMMIYKYDNFYENGKPAYVDRNNDYVSTSTYDNQKEKYKYDSFILGNSRSRYYLVNDWKECLDSSASCYHFDASNESLFGIMKKIEYIDKYSTIKNVLLVIDKDILSVTDPQTKSYLFYISPQLVEYKNSFGFFLSGFKTFVNPKFFISYFDLSLFGEIRNYMRYFNVFNENIRNYNLQYNETTWPEKEKLLSQGSYYTKERMKQFYKRNNITTCEDPCINEPQISQLSIISRIFKRNSTNYKIIISPKYDQKKLADTDLSVLREIFGYNNVFDFSGKNELTEDFRNYWDVNHYNENVAKMIIKEIYQN
jgi:hypothetical protein